MKNQQVNQSITNIYTVYVGKKKKGENIYGHKRKLRILRIHKRKLKAHIKQWCVSVKKGQNKNEKILTNMTKA